MLADIDFGKCGKGPAIALILMALVVWTFLHLPGIQYGTKDLPLHTTYIGDEQAPIFGALHILKNRSFLGLRNETSVYYGPVFSVAALPAVIGDFIWKIANGTVSGISAYREYILWDWGGIAIFARFVEVVLSFLAIVGIYFLFTRPLMNPTGNGWLPYGVALLFAFSYLFFTYASFFKHWSIVVTILVWQLYVLIRILEDTEQRVRWWFAHLLLSVTSFGISYMPVMYLSMWLPVLVVWVRNRQWKFVRQLIQYGLGFLALAGLIVAWHPYAFLRILGSIGLIKTNDTLGAILDVTTTGPINSFGAYAWLLVSNNLFALLALTVLILGLRRRMKIFSNLIVWILSVPAVLNYFIFSLPAQHVTRYMLPTSSLLLILAAYTLSLTYTTKQQRVRKLGISLLAVSLLANLVHITGWSRMIIAGPPEYSIIEQIKEWQRTDPKAKIFVAQASLLGHVHTFEAYEAYAGPHKEMSTMWQAILASKAPAKLEPLNVYYDQDGSGYTEHELTFYDHVVSREQWYTVQRTTDTHLDFFDTQPWVVWDYRSYQNKYIIEK